MENWKWLLIPILLFKMFHYCDKDTWNLEFMIVTVRREIVANLYFKMLLSEALGRRNSNNSGLNLVRKG